MSAEPGDFVPPDTRASDLDRQSVIERLREHTAAGRLSIDEFDARVEEVFAAKTVDQLRRALRELPAPLPVLATERELARRERRRRAGEHVLGFLGVNGVCITIWAVGAHGPFWPAWVLLVSGLATARRLIRNEDPDTKKKRRKARDPRWESERGQAPEDRPASPQRARVLATVLYSDLVDSTARAAEVGDRRWATMLDRFDEVVAESLAATDGHLVKSLGDGVLATFATPAAAITCAGDIRRAMGEIGLDVRSGIHTGEVEVRGDDVSGIAVHLGQRVSSVAGPGEVLVTRTVADLATGAGFSFVERGEHELRGVPGSWTLFAVSG